MNRLVKQFFFVLTITLAISVLFTSCEKEVHINLASSPPTVVVQGAIETNIPPYVILTSTLSFFSNIDLTTLQNSFLHGATVSVTDGVKSIDLKEYALDTGANNKFYVYTIDTSNLSNIMIGVEGKTYTLTVTYNGKTYTSVTKIPHPKGPDSTWFARPTFITSSTPDSAMQLFANYTDPDTPGNYVRYFTQRDNQQMWPSGLFSDEVVNGKPVNSIGLIGGYENTGSDNQYRDSLIYFFPGEKVTLKWAEIDRGVYKFYNTLQFAESATGNPFATPINVTTNVSNGAVGVWAGYGSVLITKTVPH